MRMGSRFFRRLTVTILLASLVGLPAPAAAGAYLVVDTLTDVDSADGKCSLREAITAANNNADYRECRDSDYGADTITFNVSGGITLGSSLPVVSDAAGLTIDGGGEVQISGQQSHQVFRVGSGAALTLRGLLVRNGQAQNGGAVSNVGTLTIESCTFYSNHADERGGAISATAFATTVVTGTTFSYNQAEMYGGAIANGTGIISVTNSTMAFNAGGIKGGAVATMDGWTVFLTNCTLAGNGAATAGGALYRQSGLIKVANTIVADSTQGGNCDDALGSGGIQNLGNNVDDGSTCGWGSVNGSMSNTDPRLAVLGDFGGNTETMPLLYGSPAIDGVTFNPPNGCPNVDQRGKIRPIDGDHDSTALCDIGAVEEQEGWTLDESLFLPTTIKQ